MLCLLRQRLGTRGGIFNNPRGAVGFKLRRPPMQQIEGGVFNRRNAFQDQIDASGFEGQLAAQESRQGRERITSIGQSLFQHPTLFEMVTKLRGV
ncbi:MAG: hypothetical protein AB7F89_24280 [Pirellulaceae bacterium]